VKQIFVEHRILDAIYKWRSKQFVNEHRNAGQEKGLDKEACKENLLPLAVLENIQLGSRMKEHHTLAPERVK